MRLGILGLLLIATLFGSGYWYNTFDTVCKIPIKYRIGSIDERFDSNEAEVRRIAAEAELLWEKPLTQELFVYDAEKGIPINFIFDERQGNADLETEMREDLDAKEGMSENVASQYERLIAEFRALKKKYELHVVAYESDLKSYNDLVTKWNNKGGAPKHELEELQATQRELTAEQRRLESQGEELNGLIAKLNAIGARGNSLITDYNTIVNDYNGRFSEAHEFTQGDYTGRAIDIYQFDSEEELTVVLAHEFGHALSLDHVANAKSIMYHFMNAQRISTGISAEDTTEFNRICSDRGIMVKMLRFISDLV